jgi:hypothetical protein
VRRARRWVAIAALMVLATLIVEAADEIAHAGESPTAFFVNPANAAPPLIPRRMQSIRPDAAHDTFSLSTNASHLRGLRGEKGS